MSWHVAIHGHFEFLRPADAARWTDAAVDPSATKELAKSSPEWFQARFRRTTVRTLLAEAGRFDETSGHEFIDFEVTRGRVTVRSLLSEGSLPDWLERFVAALQVAAQLGAKGAIVLVGQGDPLRARLTLGRKKVAWEVLSEASLPKHQVRAIADEISKLSKARIEQGSAEQHDGGPSAKAAGWYLAVHGRGKLGTLENGGWAKIPIDHSVTKELAAAHPEWFKASFRATTVGALLEEIRRFDEKGGPEFLEVDIDGEQVKFRGLLGEASAVLFAERLIASMVITAKAGAFMSVMFGGLAYPSTAQLKVAQGKVTWDVVTGPGEPSLARFTLDQVLPTSRERNGGVAVPMRRRNDIVVAKRKRAADNEGLAELLSAVGAAVAAHPTDAVVEAARRARVFVEEGSTLLALDDAFPNASELVAACQPEARVLIERNLSDGVFGALGGTPAFSVQVLAALDPAAAEPLAARLMASSAPILELRARAVHLAAARALGTIATPNAIATLVAALGPDAAYAATSGLARAGANAGPALLGWLSPRLRSPDPMAKQLDTLAISALAALRYEPAVEPLLEAWRSSRRTRLRGAVGAALLALGDRRAVRTLEESKNDDDDLAGRVALTALLRRDPAAAQRLLKDEIESERGPKREKENLRRLTQGKGPLDLGARMLDALTGAPMLPSLDRPIEPGLQPEAGAQWVTLAIRALDEPSLAYFACTYLAATRDPRGATALAERVGSLDLEQVLHALEYIGDASVAPLLESYASKTRKERDRVVRVKTAIGRLRRGERPSSVTTELWASPRA